MQEIITFANLLSQNDLSCAQLYITKITRKESSEVDG